MDIGVALSGSGFKFPAHIGALVAIQESGYNIVEIAGTSGGSIISALYASGMSIDDMITLCMTQDWSDMLTYNPLAILNDGWCNGNNLLDFLNEKTNEKVFKDLKVNLNILATDIDNQQPIIFNKQLTPDFKISTAARMSSSIPFIYRSLEYKYPNGTCVKTMDGGLVNNIPLDTLNKNLYRVANVLVSRLTVRDKNPKNILDLTGNIINTVLNSCENAYIDLDLHHNTTINFSETGFASGLDNKMSLLTRKKLFNSGYDSMKFSLLKNPPYLVKQLSESL